MVVNGKWCINVGGGGGGGGHGEADVTMIAPSGRMVCVGMVCFLTVKKKQIRFSVFERSRSSLLVLIYPLSASIACAPKRSADGGDNIGT